MKVQATKKVRYNGTSYLPGAEFDITAEDFATVPTGILKVTEEGVPAGAPKSRNLPDLKVDELKVLAEKFEIEGFAEMRKSDLITALEPYDLTDLL